MSLSVNTIMDSSMLILTRAIYARRSNDAFYPGTIETKLPDGSYLVKFTDNSSERVEEHDITWMGFLGLPPWCWPRNPVVQTVGSGNVNVMNGFVQNEYRKNQIADSVSFKAQSRDCIDNSKHMNGVLQMDMESEKSAYSVRKSHEQSTGEVDPLKQSFAHVLPSQATENQTRLSVLRMCSSGYLKQEASGSEKEFVSMEHNSSPDFRISPHLPLSSHEEKRHFTFNEICNTLKAMNDFTARKRKLSTTDYEECTLQEKCPRSEDEESSLQHSSLLRKHQSPPVPPLIPAKHEHVGHACNVSIYDAPSPPIPASFRLQPRARRRTENKKCRKVYGIENRDIWCTQCRWKKACTRFGNCDKSEKPGLMYIGDYEGLPYPV